MTLLKPPARGWEDQPDPVSVQVPHPFDLAVVDPDPAVRDHLALLLRSVAPVWSCPDTTAVAARQAPGQPTVAVFGLGSADADGLAAIGRLTRTRPEVAAILVAPDLSTALFQEALRSGVRDVLELPVLAEALAESVDRVGRSLTGAAPPPAPEQSDQARVVTVTSMKGGSGKSVVATNLAVALARRSDRPVALLDADLQFGDVAVMLRLSAPHTIVDAASAVDRLDSQFLKTLLVRHDPSGLLVLPAPLDPSLADRIAGSDIVRIVEILRSFCSHVVIDTPAQFNDVVLSVIEAADDIVVVAGMELPNVKNTKLGLQTMKRLGIPDSRIRLLVNRSNSKVQLDVKEVERTLGFQAEAHIPSDIVVPQAVNRGVSVILDAPRSDVARSFEQLADLFSTPTTAVVTPKKARGLFGRF